MYLGRCLCLAILLISLLCLNLSLSAALMINTMYILIVAGYLFSFVSDSNLLACLTLPDSDIHIIGCTVNKLCICGVCNWINLLHSLTMVYFPGVPLIKWEYSDCLIKWTSDKFPTSWTISNGHDCRYVILMNHSRLLHFAYIECVTIGIIISNGNIHGFNGIPCQCLSLIEHLHFMHWCFCPNII